MLMKSAAKKPIRFKVSIQRKKSEEQLADEARESNLAQGLEALKRRTRQKQSSFRSAAKAGTTKEHFTEFVKHLNPKKVYLRTLAKLDHAMPDAAKHPNLNRAARVVASAKNDLYNAAKNNPKTAAGIGAGLAALTIAGLVAKGSKKKTEIPQE